MERSDQPERSDAWKLVDSGIYTQKVEALLTGNIETLWNKLHQNFASGDFWPGYLTRLIETHTELPELIEVREDKDAIDYNFF